MKNFIKNFVSTSNEINEAVVLGLLMVLPFLVGTFSDAVSQGKYDTLALLIGSCFGIGMVRAIGLRNDKGMK